MAKTTPAKHHEHVIMVTLALANVQPDKATSFAVNLFID